MLKTLTCGYLEATVASTSRIKRQVPLWVREAARPLLARVQRGKFFSTMWPKKKNRRERLWLREGKACYYCRHPLELSEVQLDHVRPKSDGGDHGDHNRVASCMRCNSLKGVCDMEQWASKAERLLNKARVDMEYFAEIVLTLRGER